MIKKLQLPLQTLNLTVGFMIWVILSSLLPFIKEDIHIPADQLAWVTAIPVVLGSILRVPIGYYTNLFGARRIFMISFVLCIFPVYYISTANSVTDLLIGGTILRCGWSGIFGWCHFFAKVLSKGTSWICEWNLWCWKFRDRDFNICCTCNCDKVWLGNNGAIIYGSIRNLYCS